MTGGTGGAPSVLAVGEPFLVVQWPNERYRDEAILGVGGAEVNALATLATLGVSCALISRVGQDLVGDFVLESLQQLGIDTSFIERIQGERTGLQVRTSSDGDQRHMVNYRDGSAAVSTSAEQVTAAVQSVAPRAVIASGFTPGLSDALYSAVQAAAEGAASSQYRFVLDVNLRPNLPGHRVSLSALTELLPLASLVFIGLDEADELFGASTPVEALSCLAEVTSAEVVVKDAARGSWLGARGELLHVPSRATVIVDTVGAGDAFAGAYLAGVLGTLPREQAGERASHVAAQVIARYGDQWRPTRSELSRVQSMADDRGQERIG